MGEEGGGGRGERDDVDDEVNDAATDEDEDDRRNLNKTYIAVVSFETKHFPCANKKKM